MNPYPVYRPSGVEWLGDVPEHWGVLPTKHASRIVMGQSPPSDTYQDKPVERPFLQGNAEFGPYSPTPKWYCNAAPKVVGAGALLLSVRAPVGALNVADQTLGIGRGLCGIVPDPPHVDQRFAWWALHVTRRALEPIAVGSTYDAVSAEQVGVLPIPLPPLDEQRAIAEYLDRETERIDALVAKMRLLIERLQEYRTALITRTVTRGLPPDAARAAGLDPSPRLKPSGVEWLGDVPEHWEVRPLKALLSKNDSGVWGDDPEEEDVRSTIVLRSTEQTVDGGWAIEAPATRMLSPRERAGALLKVGDLVVTKSSGSEFHIGKTSLVTVEVSDLNACFSNFMQRLRCRSGFDPRLVWYLLNSPVGRQQLVFNSNTTTGLANLNGTIFGEVVTPVPPVDEQRVIAAFLDRETERIDALVAKMRLLIERLQEHRTALITAAVTGKVDVREPVAADGS